MAEELEIKTPNLRDKSQPRKGSMYHTIMNELSWPMWPHNDKKIMQNRGSIALKNSYFGGDILKKEKGLAMCPMSYVTSKTL